MIPARRIYPGMMFIGYNVMIRRANIRYLDIISPIYLLIMFNS